MDIFAWIVPAKLNYESIVEIQGMSELAPRRVVWKMCSEMFYKSYSFTKVFSNIIP